MTNGDREGGNRRARRPSSSDDRTRTELPAFMDSQAMRLGPSARAPGPDETAKLPQAAPRPEDTAKIPGLAPPPAIAPPRAPPGAALGLPPVPPPRAATALPHLQPIPRPQPLPLPRPPAAAAPAKKKPSAEIDLPGYVIDSKLGEGGMGAVYKGRFDAKLGRSVAIKVLPPHFARNPEYIARFYREAESALKLNHPNIVQGYACGEADGFHYFVMEFVDGETLEKRLKRDKKVPEKEAIEYAIGIASALECAAKEQIVHRDLKPANILVSKEGRVKLVDLGLAKQAGSGGPQLTRVGMIMGSPYYMAPEQVAMQPVDERTDLYGLGATLYHLVTGTVPFEGEDPVEIIEQVIGSPPPNPRVRHPELSPEIAAVIQKLMAKKREERYPSAHELREVLGHLHATGKLPGGKGQGAGWLRRLIGRD